MKVLKGLKALVALVLTLTMIALVPLNTAAAANNGKYVSEVYVAYGKDAEEAKKTLSDKGFTPVEGNLNDGGKTYAMMGYKTTDDIRESSASRSDPKTLSLRLLRDTHIRGFNNYRLSSKLHYKAPVQFRIEQGFV